MLVRRLPSLDELRREMGRLLDSWDDAVRWNAPGVFPPINVSETPDAIVVRAEVPGVAPDALDIRVENQTLTISGERRAPEYENASLHRREREWGRFRRSFSLPIRIDTTAVKARCAQGILTVELPKAAEARPKQITVQAGA